MTSIVEKGIVMTMRTLNRFTGENRKLTNQFIKTMIQVDQVKKRNTTNQRKIN
jgi:hypothetical protein